MNRSRIAPLLFLLIVLIQLSAFLGVDLFAPSAAGRETQSQTSVKDSVAEQLPRFSSFDSLALCLREHTDASAKTIRFILEGEPASMALSDVYDQLYRLMPSVKSYQAKYSENRSERVMTLTPTYYPGKRMAHAWQTGDAGGLSPEERQCLKKAVSLIDEFRFMCKDTLSMEAAIHDYLCETVSYLSQDDGPQYVRSAIGALLHGRSNCMGYTDAFYLLGTIAGLDVGYVSGLSDGEAHAWNSIRLDGSYYAVDVTYDDNDASWNIPGYAYFNAGCDLLSSEREWYDFPAPYHISAQTSEKWSYYNGSADYGARVQSAEEAIQYFLHATKDGKPLAHVMIEHQEIDSEAIKAASRTVTQGRRAPASWHYVYTHLGGHTFLSFEITEW